MMFVPFFSVFSFFFSFSFLWEWILKGVFVFVSCALLGDGDVCVGL